MAKIKFLKSGTVSPFGYGQTIDCDKGVETDVSDDIAIALKNIGWAEFAVEMSPKDRETKVSTPAETKVVEATEIKETKAPRKRGRKPKAEQE